MQEQAGITKKLPRSGLVQQPITDISQVAITLDYQNCKVVYSALLPMGVQKYWCATIVVLVAVFWMVWQCKEEEYQ